MAARVMSLFIFCWCPLPQAFYWCEQSNLQMSKLIIFTLIITPSIVIPTRYKQHNKFESLEHVINKKVSTDMNAMFIN